MKHCRIAAAVILIIFLLSGCGGSRQPAVPAEPTLPPVTAADILEKSDAAVTRAGSSVSEVSGVLSFTSWKYDAQRELTASVQLTAESLRADRQLHAVGTANVELLGAQLELPVELYMDKSGIAVGIMDQWQRMELPVPGEEQDALRAAAILEKGTETVGEHRCLCLRAEATQEMLAQATDGRAGRGGPIRCALWVDEVSFLPVRLTVSLAAPVVTQEVTLRAMELTVDYVNFGTVESIPVPAGAMGEA